MAVPREGGWASIQRKLIKSDLWLSEVFTRGQAWVDLIMLASHKSSYVRIRGVRIDVERGQFATAERFLCERWKWSRGKVRRFLNELESDKQIVQQKNNASTVVTITNYDKYQGDGTAGYTTNRTTNRTTSDTTDRTTDRTADGPNTRTKELKKEKKGNKGDTPQPPVVLPPSIRTDAMEAAVAEWMAYKAERGERYKPMGLKKFLTQLSSAVALHGEASIIAKFDKAMSSGWKGWDFADSTPRGSPLFPEDPRGNFNAAHQYLESLK